MFFFKRRKKKLSEAERRKLEVETELMRQQALKNMDRTTKVANDLNKLLESADITELIFYATGGDRRKRHGK